MNENTELDITTPLTHSEAGRFITVMLTRGLSLKKREVYGFPPKEIAETLQQNNIKITAEQVAKFAGR